MGNSEKITEIGENTRDFVEKEASLYPYSRAIFTGLESKVK